MEMFLKNEFENQLSDDIKSAVFSTIQIAENTNTNIFLIGGIVRDLIMNNQIKDIDIAVEGNAIDFAKELEKNNNCEIVKIQENLKTACVKFDNNVEIDFASTREETYSKSGILPVANNFGCKLALDVKRRDFTINTLALQLNGENKYKLIDYFNGYNDIKEKRIKILHNKSFIDDPSRIIRALKFKIRFDFDFDESTYEKMQDYLINPDRTIPFERIKNELNQYFSIKKNGLYNELIENNIYKLFSDNYINQIDENIFNEISKFDLFEEKDYSLVLILSMLLNKSQLEENLNLTSLEKRIIEETNNLLNSKVPSYNDNLSIYKRYIDKTNLTLLLYYLISKEKTVYKFLDVLKQIKILITGKELISLGFIPSSYFNLIFDTVLKEKLNGKLKTLEEEIEFVKKLNKKAE